MAIDTCYTEVEGGNSVQPESSESGKAKKRKLSKKNNLANLNFSWTELAPKKDMKGDSHNIVVLEKPSEKVNFLRVKSYPDGGIARLRVYGTIVPEPMKSDEIRDLAFVGNGGQVVFVTDEHFGNKGAILNPGLGVNMGDGWETRRTRTPGHTDHCIVKLGAQGKLDHIDVYTTHFKGNYPQHVEVFATTAQSIDGDVSWVPITDKVAGEAHSVLKMKVLDGVKDTAFGFVKLVMHPDGGISRLRVFGVPVKNE